MEKKISCHYCLTLVLLICSACFYNVASKPTENIKSMLEAINFCPTVNFVKNSSYMTNCHKLPYPTTNLKDVDKDLVSKVAMCMVVYDITSKICVYNSKIPLINKLKVPETSADFDAEIKKLEPKSKKDYATFMTNLCKSVPSIFHSLNNIDIESNSDVVSYVKYVNETLLSQTECSYTCHSPNNEVNSFCMLLLWANELFNTVKPIKSVPNVDTNIPIKQDPVSVANVQKEPILQNTKNVPIESSKPKLDQKEEPAAAVNKDLLRKPADKSLPSNSPKVIDDSKKKLVDASTDHKIADVQKDPNTRKTDDETKDEVNKPLPSNNDKTSSAISKPLDNIAENPIVVQPEKGNPDNDFISGEERQNKKADEIEAEEGNEHENLDIDVKESINNNLDDGVFPAGNLADQHDLPQDGKKFFAHSSLVKEEDESHFFTYFSIITLLCIGLYVGYHNKQKILAMVLEGRRSRRGRGSRRRPSTASYRKLDCNLEEAVTSQCNSDVTHVIY